MKEQESLNPRSNLTPTLEISNHRLNPTPTLTTLTQSDHDIIRTFLSSVPLGFPLSPGAALAELTGYAPLSPGLVGLTERSFHPSPSRFESYSDLPISFRSRSVNSPLRIDSPYRSHTGISSPLRISEQAGTLKRFEHIPSFSPHRRSPSPPPRSHPSPYRIFHSNHVYAPILPSRAFDYTTPAPSPPQTREHTPALSPPHAVDEPPIQDYSLTGQLKDQIKVNFVPEIRVNIDSSLDDRTAVNCRDEGSAIRVQVDPAAPVHNDEVLSTNSRLKVILKESSHLIKESCTKDTNLKRTRRQDKKRKKIKKTCKSKPILREEISSNPNPENGSLETSSSQVETRLKKGCGCEQDCFQFLISDNVYNHRLNISKLTKREHDMYLMGMMMASLGDPNQTTKLKHRKRRRNKYMYQGREVCQEAYIYLENVTIYQLNRL
ncbi:uncharacterized protein LOC111701225 [Eurytemora carolleeae]|uniref:uncharacterized protein LOC111701225 n=1 Tax=Eurytemora carolleeae TaxID=1294199 RepID=UPI000C77DF4F|nr:uncharacterized protein LOC111701225 [Eurytemora carolleeae]XP_023328190.1 uncharacterized protein LOC111701225 [Eurytemora carolleeae]|eukprot:XP_023328184.1 uncharacterized protein LOC111701225 [Eurytemora affinis]